MDIMVDNGPLSPHKKIYINENLAGPDNTPTPTSSDWKEHVILEGYVSHDTVVGNVDGDGDLDIGYCIKGMDQWFYLLFEE